jgi:Fur family transcriptional regulator, iron response regulator
MLFVPNESRERLGAGQSDYAVPSKFASDFLQRAGLRLTRQRIALGEFLFREGHRHITAEELRQEAIEAGVPLSQATVYNTLNQFAEAGLVRKVCVNGGRTYFDTDLGNHQHFYVGAENRLVDVPAGQSEFAKLPEPPEGYAIAKVDVVIHLVRNKPQGRSRPRLCR